MNASAAAGGPQARIAVWGAAVRLCHWGLAACIVAALVLDDGGPVHRWIGYAAAAIVALRWVAAMAGARGASLRRMVPSWRDTRQYLHQLRQGRPPRHAAHDPLGLWMVWLLWALVLALAVTGWMSRLDAFWGDETLDAVHIWLSDTWSPRCWCTWPGCSP